MASMLVITAASGCLRFGPDLPHGCPVSLSASAVRLCFLSRVHVFESCCIADRGSVSVWTAQAERERATPAPAVGADGIRETCSMSEESVVALTY